LIEVLVSLAILAIIGVGATALSIGGVVSIKDSVSETTKGAVAVDLVSMTFARDVQGSSGLLAECAKGAGGVHLLTLAQTDPERLPVEYRRSESAPYTLLRSECVGSASKTAAAARTSQAPAQRAVLEDLELPPRFECDGSECVAGSTPRSVILQVTPEGSSQFTLEGVRRSDVVAPGEAPIEVSRDGQLLLLGGLRPLTVSNSSKVAVTGDALVNRPAGGTEAILLNGNPRLEVSRTFAMQQGSTCTGCDGFADQMPGGFAQAVLDPLAELVVPDSTDLATRTDCPIEGKVRICSPGVYPQAFPPKAGAVSDYWLEAGTYVLSDGMNMGHGTLQGDGVLFHNPRSSLRIQSDARVELTPPDHGDVAGVLVDQPSGNTNPVIVSGNARVVSPGSLLHLPGAELQVLNSAEVGVGSVIARSMAALGNARVTIGDQ